ncbi:alpha/beta hydrolase [bacterium]|nr:alpha/beta hydrolase [bacterium]
MTEIKQAFISSFDGTEIYYEASGKGLPIVLCDGVGCAGYVWKYFEQHFRATNRLIHMHYRGHGKSAVPEDGNLLRIVDTVKDIARVLDDDGQESAILVGHSMGVQVILEFYRQYPERVDGLVPVCGSYGHPLRTFNNANVEWVFPLFYFPAVLTPWVFTPLWKYLAPSKIGYWMAVMTEINHHLVHEEDFLPYFRDLAKVPVRVFMKMVDSASRHTAEDILGTIRVPVLIVAGEHDGFTPGRLSEHMRDAIPGAELLMLAKSTHTAPIEQPQLMNLRIEKWLRRHFGQLPPDEQHLATRRLDLNLKVAARR